MKIKFEEDLDYQIDAINSVIDIFNGQKITKSQFTIEKTNTGQMKLGSIENELGIGNNLILLPEEIEENLNKIQTRNGLPKTKNLKKNNYNFSVEMETGTGKTYVYIRTILELNKKYGFTKFIIVVPSIAIKEGVYKTLEITKEHFKKLYDNVPYDFFIYDSKKLDMIRNFAVNDSIQIMIITIDAFNRDTNVIKDSRDQANGYRPIDYIQQCNPIVIIDEPQNMETEIAKKAIENLNPLCTLRYSATHKEKYNEIFRLDSVMAYKKELVKQIVVASVKLEEDKNLEYIKLIEVKIPKGANKPSAKIEIDMKSKDGVRRKIVSIEQGDFLNEKTKLAKYEGYEVENIKFDPEDNAKSYVELRRTKLYLNQVNGDKAPEEAKRIQIRKTIEEHFEKQLRLKKQGIKVLSLFFIDKVANYRTYNSETGEAQKGKYALIFEEEYEKLLELPKYQELNDQTIPLKERIAKVHNGYFSADKKKSKNGKEYYEEKDTSGKTNADNETFNKIMKDKEVLLSFSEPLSFIFSHSALREGWDNPNVFQICTLNETNSNMKKKQEIGRGLRIAVNQLGQRVRGFDINTLTVMANESYAEFVEQFQKEMEEDNKDFGLLKDYLFTDIVIGVENEREIYLGHDNSKIIYNFLQKNDYIDSKGKPTDKLKIDLKENKLELPQEFENIEEKIIEKIKSTSVKLIIKNANDKKKIKINKQILLSPDFERLWDKIKYKTTYQVNFDNEALIRKCINNVDNNLSNQEKRTYTYEKAKLDISNIGVDIKEVNNKIEKLDIKVKYKLPDIITYLQNETNLTRKSIVEILTKTKTLDSFKKNPQTYLEEVSNIIRNTMKTFIVDGIKYEKIGNEEYYSQELFENKEIITYLKSEAEKQGYNLFESKKSPYDNIILDSKIENDFAKALEENENISVYAKLPDWFKIATPLGNYNPDWAILVKSSFNEGEEKLYFVVETKGTLDKEERRENENKKIDCGKKHFQAISTDLKFETTNSFENLAKKF